jgi:hypothetical protein
METILRNSTLQIKMLLIFGMRQKEKKEQMKFLKNI